MMNFKLVFILGCVAILLTPTYAANETLADESYPVYCRILENDCIRTSYLVTRKCCPVKSVMPDGWCRIRDTDEEDGVLAYDRMFECCGVYGLETSAFEELKKEHPDWAAHHSEHEPEPECGFEEKVRRIEQEFRLEQEAQ